MAVLMTPLQLARLLRDVGVRGFAGSDAQNRMRLYALVEDGRIPSLRIGGRIQFVASDIAEWLVAEVREHA